jgi:CHAT domain-containing protein/Flp pilus assembly protein TadD
MKRLWILLICFFLIQISGLQAQDWQKQFQSGVSAYQAGNHQEAIKQLLQAKQGAADYVGKNNINYFYIVTILARAYEDNLQIKEAEKEFAEAYTLAKNLFPQNQEGFLVLAAHNLGKNYYLQQNYPQAEKYTTEAYEFIKNEPQNQDYLSVCHTLGAIYKELEKFGEAEKLFSEVKKRSTPENKLFFNALNGLAVIAFKKGKLKEAEQIFLELLATSEKKFGKNAEYTTYLHNLGGFYKEIHQTRKAEIYLKEALQLREKFWGNKHPDYALTCSYLGYVYQDLGKWQEAEKLFLTAKNIYKEQNLQQDYVLILNNLASLKEAQALYREAEKLYTEALQLCEKVLGKEHSTYSMLTANMAGLYYKQGFFTKAEPLYQNALRLDEKIFSKNSLQYQQTAMNYAIFKFQKGEIGFAEKELEKSLQFFEKNTGKNSLPYITALQNLAMIDLQKENFLQAEEKYLQAQSLCEQATGKPSETYVTLLNNFAQFYTSLGNTDKALSLYKEIWTLAGNIWSEKHINYAIALRNIAYLYLMQGNMQDAEKLCLQSLEIIQKNYGESHPEYINSLNNLAAVNYYQKNYKNLISNLQKALSLTEQLYGKEHKLSATLQNNLAIAYIQNGDYGKAMPLLTQTLSTKEKIFGKEHQEYLIAETNLAWLYALQNKFSESEKLYKQLASKQVDRIFKVFPILSESEKMAFVAGQGTFFLNYVNFCFDYAPQKPAILGDLMDLRLLTKGMVAEASQNLQKKVLALNNAEIAKIYKDWLAKKNEYLKIINAPNSEKTATQIKQISDELNILEKELSKKVDISGKKRERYSWKDVQKQLKADEIAIEVIRTLDKNSANPQKIDTIYAFLIITAQTTTNPELVFVPNASLLETEQISLYQNSIKTRKSQYYKELYDSFWGNAIKQSKVLKNLNYKKIYFSPDGIYHKINLATLYDETKKQFLGDFLQIYQLTNLKKLAQPNSTIKNNKNAFLVGYPDYKGTEKTSENEPNRGFVQKVKPQEKQKLSRFLDFESVSYLPGTKKETDQISQILAKNGIKIALLQDKEATEEAIKKIKQPHILHIATHGFFLEDVPFEEEKISFGSKELEVAQNPLLRAGLLLANCSSSLKKSEMNTNREDGILTAYEAGQLDLQNTDLVVLSACETGLGEIQNGEGVFGLQRAFLQAGAKNLIISLWKVDDAATQEFMTILYENWQAKKLSLEDSFFEAQKAIRQKYTEPYYWGAFVMVGE